MTKVLTLTGLEVSAGRTFQGFVTAIYSVTIQVTSDPVEVIVPGISEEIADIEDSEDTEDTEDIIEAEVTEETETVEEEISEL